MEERDAEAVRAVDGVGVRGDEREDVRDDVRDDGAEGGFDP